jgi:nicotinate-nucleotide adenylyltransferase
LKTVGLFGGTFDPVHRGHLDVARVVRQALSLDEIWFIPARHPPHRTAPAASASHRFAMVALALAGRPEMKACDAEMDGNGPSYTIDTLDALEAAWPALTGRLCFITGADAFRDIATWRAWTTLLSRAHFAVVSRPGCPAPSLRAVLPELAPRMQDAPAPLGTEPGIFLVDAVTSAVSSTEARQALRQGVPTGGLLPESVAEYALRQNLYTGMAPQEAARG